MICVSKCLLGENCRYDGGNMRNEKVIDYLKDKEYVSVCPECLGGLTTPREPSEIIHGRVFSCTMKDVDAQFHLGAQKALEIAKQNNCKQAILKEDSPSCGVFRIYDGTFSGKKITGRGVCAKLFEENGIELISSDQFE